MNKGRLPLTKILTEMRNPISIHIPTYYKNAHSAQESILACASKINIPISTTFYNDYMVVTRLDLADTQYDYEFFELLNTVIW